MTDDWKPEPHPPEWLVWLAVAAIVAVVTWAVILAKVDAEGTYFP